MISFLDLTVKGLFVPCVCILIKILVHTLDPHEEPEASEASKLAIWVLLFWALAMLKLLFVICRSVATCEALVKNQYSLLGWEYSEADSDDNQNLAGCGKSQPTQALWTCPCSRFLCFYLYSLLLLLLFFKMLNVICAYPSFRKVTIIGTWAVWESRSKEVTTGVLPHVQASVKTLWAWRQKNQQAASGSVDATFPAGTQFHTSANIADQETQVFSDLKDFQKEDKVGAKGWETRYN